MTIIEPDSEYAIEGSDVLKLEQIRIRLYDGRTLSYDQRRDMAFIVSGIVDNAVKQPNHLDE